MRGIVFGQRIGCDVVAAPPDVHLLFAEAGRRFALVEPLQYAVMFLVEAPVFLDGDPFLIEPVENTVQGPDGPFQVGGVGFAETESFGFEQFSGFEGLFDAFVREIDVRPSREAVFAVPRAFAVPQQYDFFHGMICFYLYFHFVEALSVGECLNVFEGRAGDVVQRLAGEESLVGGEDHVVEGEQACQHVVVHDPVGGVLIEVIRLFLIDIQPRRSDLFLLESFDQVARADQLPASRVDDDDPVFHLTDGFGVDHVEGSVREGTVQRDDVRAAVEFGQRNVGHT